MDTLCPFIVNFHLRSVLVSVHLHNRPSADLYLERFEIALHLPTTDGEFKFIVRRRVGLSAISSQKLPIDASVTWPITGLNYQFFVYSGQIGSFVDKNGKKQTFNHIVNLFSINVPNKIGKYEVPKLYNGTKFGAFQLDFIIEKQEGDCTNHSPDTTTTSKSRSTESSNQNECQRLNESTFPVQLIIIIVLVVILIFTIIFSIKQSLKLKVTKGKGKEQEKKPIRIKMIPHNQKTSQFAATQYCDSLTMDSTRNDYRSTFAMLYSKQNTTRTNGKQTMSNLKQVGQKNATQNNDVKTKQGQSTSVTPVSVSKTKCLF